jgi:hypothetical protein
MSGWDVSSMPSWESQDGPEETQAFPASSSRELGQQDPGARDYGRTPPRSPAAGFPGAPDGFDAGGAPAGPPAEFFTTGFGPEDSRELTPGGYPRRTPGQSLQDLPRREPQGRHSSAQPGGFGQDGAFSQDSSYGRDGGFGQDSSYGQDSAYGLGWGGSSDQPRPQTQAQPQFGGSGVPQEPDGDWERATGRPPARWLERPREDAGYQDQPAPAFAGQDYPGSGRPGPDGRDYDRQARDVQDFGQPGYRGQDGSGPDYPAPEYAGQGRASRGYGDQGYAGQDYPGRPGPGAQPQALDDRRGPDQSAQLDPALQDFFAPPRGAAPGYQDPWGDGAAGPAGPGYRQDDADWGATPDRPRSPDRRPPAAEPRRGLGTRGFVAIGAVVAIIIVVAVVVFTRHSGSSPTAAGTSPSAPASAPAAGPSTGQASGTTSSSGSAGTAAYVLSKPASADGFPKGSDPKFLAIATSTAGQVSSAVTQGDAGTIKGSPVSAAYQLPAGGQVVTFVGYQGTFTPAKVETLLSSLGTDPHTYTAGTLGGILGCANTRASGMVTSGAVCVWADSSTLGVTEFFSSTGPEALTSSQDKGATDTARMRADIEVKSS